jgi:hypothetical protein
MIDVYEALLMAWWILVGVVGLSILATVVEDLWERRGK